jgi:hypothetical protein
VPPRFSYFCVFFVQAPDGANKSFRGMVNVRIKVFGC